MDFQPAVDAVARIPVLGLVVRAVLKSQADQAKDMAASIAYFGFFSIFPLLLGAVVVTSHFLDWNEIESRLDSVLWDALPGSADFVKKNLEALVRLRGAASVISILGLLWAAGRVLGAVSRGVNLALGQTRTHSLLLEPVRHVALMVLVSLLLFLSVGVSTTLQLLAGRESGLVGQGLTGFLTIADGHLASFVFVLVTLAWLYALLPYEKPAWRDILPGAVLAALLFELGKTGFVFYLENIAKLDAVYGSVSSIIVLLLWFYFSARVLLLGVQLIAVRQGLDRPEDP
jgi:membrane protein